MFVFVIAGVSVRGKITTNSRRARQAADWLTAKSANSQAGRCYGFSLFPMGGLSTDHFYTRNTAFPTDSNGRDTQSDHFQTILNHGSAHTRTYLATSQSQSLTWLSCSTNAAGLDLNLTSSSETGSVRQSEIASAGIPGAGHPAKIFEFLVGRGVPTAPSAADDTNGGLGTARPATANGRDHASGVASARSTSDFRSDRQDACPTTILNCGLARTRTYLAISRSQSQTWLSCTHTTAGHDLNLTSSSEAGSGDNRSAVVVRHLKIQELTTTS